MSSFTALDPAAAIKRILVVEDDPDLRRLLEMKLENSGYEVFAAANGKLALEVINRRGLPHLALVDINMPEMDGLQFCEAIQRFSDLPVIMLTAVNDADTVTQTIDRYAEDYVVKPFNLNELMARINRVLRRVPEYDYVGDAVMRVDEQMTVNFPRQQLVVDGTAISLTPIETKLLYVLMANTARIVTPEFLLQRVWPNEEIYEDVLRVHVFRLRRKLQTGKTKHQYIITERGEGYRFLPDSGRDGAKKPGSAKPARKRSVADDAV